MAVYGFIFISLTSRLMSSQAYLQWNVIYNGHLWAECLWL